MKAKFTCVSVEPEDHTHDGVPCSLNCVTLKAVCEHGVHDSCITLRFEDDCFKVGCCYCVEFVEECEV